MDLEPEKKQLSNGFRVSEPYSVSKMPPNYVADMVAAIKRERPFEPRVVPTHFKGKLISELSASERDEFIFSVQAKSTQTTLSRDPSEDAAYIYAKKNTPIDPSAQVRDESGNIDHGTRHLGVEELLLVEDTRRKPKNSLGQGTESGASEETRKRASEAFTYSKPYNPTDAELDRLQKIRAVEAGEVAIPEFGAHEAERAEYKLDLMERLRLWFDEKFGDSWLFK